MLLTLVCGDCPLLAVLVLDVRSTGFKIMEMDVMYDDTCLKVMGLHERSSLSPEDVSVIASLDSAHTAG